MGKLNACVEIYFLKGKLNVTCQWNAIFQYYGYDIFNFNCAVLKIIFSNFTFFIKNGLIKVKCK